MIADIEDGKINCVITKDLSRLGRNYLETGGYTEIYFPEHGVRYIAVTNGVDTAKGSTMDITPFKNLLNDMYARDVSRKIKAVLHNKGNSGQIMSTVPIYGYTKDPNDKKHWLVDDEAAEVVREIFELYTNGCGSKKIADSLEEKQILSPSHYFKQKGMPLRPRLNENPYKWNSGSVNRILSHREYCGDVVNFKTFKKSYKSHKTLKNPEENQLVFENVNEPIISRDVWNKAQSLLEKGRRVPIEREPDLFQSYLVCSDCGSKLYIRRTKNGKNNYLCSGYAKKITDCSIHSISQDNLYEIVLKNLNEIASVAKFDKKQFAETLRQKADVDNKSEMKKIVKDAEKMKSRTANLNKIIHQLFEDRVDGKISEERYLEMLTAYENEQSEIKDKLAEYEEKIYAEKSSKNDIDRFIKLVNEYGEIKELTPLILSEFVEEIRVHQAEKTEDGRVQAVDIVYRGVGVLD